jgi:hypothetical protein
MQRLFVQGSGHDRISETCLHKTNCRSQILKSGIASQSTHRSHWSLQDCFSGWIPAGNEASVVSVTQSLMEISHRFVPLIQLRDPEVNAEHLRGTTKDLRMTNQNAAVIVPDWVVRDCADDDFGANPGDITRCDSNNPLTNGHTLLESATEYVGSSALTYGYSDLFMIINDSADCSLWQQLTAQTMFSTAR